MKKYDYKVETKIQRLGARFTDHHFQKAEQDSKLC